MKKLTLILFVGLLASCNKEPIEKTSVCEEIRWAV